MSKIIVIDPGHGGTDPGAIGNGLREKDLTLDISKRIKKHLEDNYTGHKVLMTRTNDKYLTLAQRAQFANDNNADYFMSTHINAGGGTGYESFIHTNTQAATSGMQNTVHSEAIKNMSVTDRGKKRANFAVLRLTKMPAILPENLFIDRKADADKLKDNNFLDKVAEGHAIGIAKALKLKSKSGGTVNQPKPPTTSKPTPKPEAPKSKQRGVATVTVPSLSLRMAPNVKGKLIRTLKKGESYKVWDEQGGWLRLGKDMWASWQNGAYMDWTEKPTKNQSGLSKPTAPRTFKVGQKVKIKSSATKYATGQRIPAQYKNKTYTIQQLKSDRMLIKELVSWVFMKDIV